MASSRDVLIVAECATETLSASVCETMSLARRIVAESGGDIVAVVLGNGDPEIMQALAHRGARRVLHARAITIAELPAEARLPALAEACARTSPRLVLFAHDHVSAELAPRLAFRVDGAAATGCIDVAVGVGGNVLCTRPCYGGLARETIEYSRTPVIATIKAGVFEPAVADQTHAVSVEALGVGIDGLSRQRIVDRESEPTEGIRLEEARIVVAGGRGLEGAQGFSVLQALAIELGGAVGASRVPCDLGWCPHSWQIGLTGKTVTPDLYFAVGISGAGHHMAGCGNAKTIVAINTDPEAAIFQDARYGIVGDYRDIVPALTAEIRKLKQAR